MARPQHDGELRRRRVVDVHLRRANVVLAATVGAVLAAGVDAVLAAPVDAVLAATFAATLAALIFFFNRRHAGAVIVVFVFVVPAAHGSVEHLGAWR